MDELKKRLMEQLGLDEGKSEGAIQVVLGYIKEQLPEGMQGMVDNFVSGGGDGDGEGGNPLDAVKGLFGGD